MKIVRYVKLYPGIKPDDVWFEKPTATEELPPGWKRYRVTVEVPDVEPPVDGDAETIIEEL